jgi:hypothetical protein
MHEVASILGYLDIDGCAPSDTIEAQFDASCLSCSATVSFKKVPFTGMEYSENCRECHTKLSVSIEG